MVYNLVVEIRNKQTKPKKQTLRTFEAYILSDVSLQNRRGKGFGGWLHESVKALGRTEPLKGSPELGREVSAFHETRVEEK